MLHATLIGITIGRTQNANSPLPTATVSEAYLRAVQAAGGIPLLIPASTPAERLNDLFARLDGFNRWNDAERRSFDDVFWKRMFGSYIYKESNVYDRRIQAYAKAMDGLLEAERIKDELFRVEHDLWEY